MSVILKKSGTLTAFLADNIKIQLGDKGYSDQELFEHLLVKGLILLTPPKKGTGQGKINDLRKILYKRFCLSGYSYLRSVTVEPFIGRLKSLFDLDPLHEKGLKRVRISILSSVIVYQLLMLYNVENNLKMGTLKELLEQI